MFRFRSLTAKYSFIGFIFVSVIAAFIYAGFRFTHHIEDEATKINMTGQLRYISFEIAWLSQKLVGKKYLSAVEQESIKDEIEFEIYRFEANMEALRKGNEVLDLTPLSQKDAVIMLDRFNDEWNEVLKPVVLEIMNLPDNVQPEDVRGLISPYDARVHDYVYEIDTLVKLLEDSYRAKIRHSDYIRFVILAFFILSMVFISIFAAKSIIKPVSELKNAASEIKKGNFNARVDIKSGDEIGTLGGTFNNMAQTLDQLFMEKTEHMRELSVLNRISAAASQTLTLEVLLENVMDEILSLEPLCIENKGAIFLTDNNKKTLKLVVSRNLSEEHANLCATVPYGECLAGTAAEKGEMIISESCFKDTRHTRTYSDAKDHGHIILPLKSRDKMLGVLCLYISAGMKLSEREIALFKSIAEILSVSMQNAINHRQVAMLAQSLDSSMDLITIADTEGKIIHINPWSYSYLGYTREELKGKDVSIMQSPNNPPDLGKEIFEGSLKGGWEGEVINIRKDGSEYPVYLTTSPVRDSDGNIIALIGISRDISEQKKAEEALKESELNLRNAQRIAHLGSWDWDVVNKRLSWSEEIYSIFGLKPHEFNGTYEAFLSNVHPEDRAYVMREVEGALNEKKPYGIDHRILLPDGSVRTVHEQAEVVFDDSGRLVRMTGTVQDITELKNAEERLRRHSEELFSLNMALSSILKIGNLKELYTAICEHAMRLFEVKMAWLGLAEQDTYQINRVASAGAEEEYLSSIELAWDDSPAGSGPAGMSIKTMKPFVQNVDELMMDKWKKEAWERGYRSILGVPLICAKDKCLGSLLFYSERPDYFDPRRIELCRIYANQAATVIENAKLVENLEEKIRERTNEIEDALREMQYLNAELEQRKAEAEAANRSKSDFLANMSHELRTPMNAIIGFSEIMREGMAGPVNSEQEEYLADILDSSRHLLSLINDILDLSKVEAGKMELELSEFSLKELIDSSLVMFREKALTHNISLSSDVEEETGFIIADNRKIKQALFNLLSNAMKFTPDGGSVFVRARRIHDAGYMIQDTPLSPPLPRGEIKGDMYPESGILHPEGDFIEISVTDTGIGISEEDQKKLFQPFQQLETTLTKKAAGTGLGLNLCRKFVELHGGRIWVESEEGKGSRFIFVIPVKQKSESRSQESE